MFIMYRTKGFTLIEILLVIAIIAILAGIVIIAINPAKQLADARNAQRWSDVNAVLNAVYQYAIDNDGDLPAALINSGVCNATITNAEICQTDAGVCGTLTDLSDLTDGSEYLIEMPVDPKETGGTATGYYIVESDDNRVTVCAPSAEENEIISVSR